MRNKKTQGFTLIELLIVIAIIGILAAVLIPNLLGARRTAIDRAAQAYAQNVFTVANAALAENVNLAPGDLATNCGGGGAYVPTTGSSYKTSAPSFALTGCTLAVTTAGDITVSVAYGGGNQSTVSLGF